MCGSVIYCHNNPTQWTIITFQYIITIHIDLTPESVKLSWSGCTQLRPGCRWVPRLAFWGWACLHPWGWLPVGWSRLAQLSNLQAHPGMPISWRWQRTRVSKPNNARCSSSFYLYHISSRPTGQSKFHGQALCQKGRITQSDMASDINVVVSETLGPCNPPCMWAKLTPQR